jgi:hypothetical protein
MNSRCQQLHRMEMNTMNNSRRFTPHTATLLSRMRVAAAVSLVAGLGLTTLLTGCGMSVSSATAGSATTTPPASTASTVKATGRVYGGQQPISGATIQLYAVGTTGLKSASIALIASPPISKSDGTFDITGDYSCANATDVYLVATGGDSGSGTNSVISQVAALGSCATLLANAATTYINVNELTTVAAAYALAPFATDYAHIGAAGVSPAGMTVAFANAALLVNTDSGNAGGANLSTGVTVPTAELNTLGNIIASCVNTSGSSSSPCSSLFSATSASDTFAAALAIAKSAGKPAITNLYTLANAQAPFQPSLALASAPHDFTVGVTMAGSAGTLSTPYGLAIDAAGNAWVTNESGTTVAAFSPTGSFATLTAAGLVGPQAVAIDKNDHVWVANTAGNSVVEFTPGVGYVPGVSTATMSGNFTAGGITAPTALAVDASNNVWIANFNGNSVSALTSSGAPMPNSPFTGASNNITVPTGIAIGGRGNVYVTSGRGTVVNGSPVNSSVVNLSSSGAFVSTLSQGALQGPAGIAIDPATNNAIVTGSTTGSSIAGAVSEFTGGSGSTAAIPVTSGLSSPAGVASDGTSIWVANSAPGGGLAQLAYGATAPMSPSTGFGSLNTPVGVAVDPSGSVWTTNSGDNTLTKFIGMATPVVTPIAATLPTS